MTSNRVCPNCQGGEGFAQLACGVCNGTGIVQSEAGENNDKANVTLEAESKITSETKTEFEQTRDEVVRRSVGIKPAKSPALLELEEVQAKATSEEADTLQNTGIPGKSGDTTPDSFEDEVESALLQYEYRYVEAVNDNYNGAKAAANFEAAKKRIVVAHLAELQALASSHNWRVQLEDHIKQLERDK